MHSLPDLETGIRKIKGKTAILNITSYCNADCIFCSEGNHVHPVNVDMAVIKETVLKLKTQGVREINFMGGETTLRNDFEEILKFIHRQGIHTYLVTNGIRFSDLKFTKKILKYLGSVEISFHAPEKKMFQRLTGVDCFENILNGIENIKKCNRRIFIFFNFIPNSINFIKITDTLRLLKKIMGSDYFCFHVKTLNVEGKVEENTDLVPDYGRFKGYLKKAIRYAIRKNIGIVISRFPLCLYDGFEYLSLELPLELRENKSFFYNYRILSRDMQLETKSILNQPNTSKIIRCLSCSLRRICPGLNSEYLKVRSGISFLAPQKKTICSVIEKMIRHSYFFKRDYLFHTYPFKVRLNHKRSDNNRDHQLAKRLEAVLCSNDFYAKSNVCR